jgi:hypothetical protein
MSNNYPITPTKKLKESGEISSLKLTEFSPGKSNILSGKKLELVLVYLCIYFY